MANRGPDFPLLASVNTDTSLFQRDETFGLRGSKGTSSAVVAGFSDYLLHLVMDFN